MPMRVSWEPDFDVGHDLIDAQHRDLLAQCDRLADHCEAGEGEAGDRQFDQDFDRLKALAREHFETEASLLAGRGWPGLEDHRIECDEFEYLADEIVTTENFDRRELQRFLTLWWLGHIRGSARPLREFLAGGNAGADR